MKNPQLSFWKPAKKSHGGEASKGHRKIARPIAIKKPMHVVLKSTRARGNWSLLKHKAPVEAIVHGTAKRFRVKVLRYQNVGNHLHLGLQAASRREFQNFLRVLPQKIMFLVTGARRGNPIGKFWDHLAFSRVVEWGRDWLGIRNYFEKNRLEAKGIPRDVVDLWFELGKGVG